MTEVSLAIPSFGVVGWSDFRRGEQLGHKRIAQTNHRYVIVHRDGCEGV